MYQYITMPYKSESYTDISKCPTSELGAVARAHPRCTNCNKKGHTRKKCPQNK